MGHTGQVTLSVLGKPVDVTIDCCLAPRHHGPCKHFHPSKKVLPRIRDTKPGREGVPRAQLHPKPANRAEEVKQILDKPNHYGKPIAQVKHDMAQLGARPGWSYHPNVLTADFDGPRGQGRVAVVSNGYLGSTRSGEKSFPNLEHAVSWVQAQVGEIAARPGSR